MFPTFAFRQAWESLDNQLDSRKACQEFVKILNEAARPNCEEKVNNYLEESLASNRLPKSEEVRALLRAFSIKVPPLKNTAVDLSDYDALLNCEQGGGL